MNLISEISKWDALQFNGNLDFQLISVVDDFVQSYLWRKQRTWYIHEWILTILRNGNSIHEVLLFRSSLVEEMQILLSYYQWIFLLCMSSTHAYALFMVYNVWSFETCLLRCPHGWRIRWGLFLSHMGDIMISGLPLQLHWCSTSSMILVHGLIFFIFSKCYVVCMNPNYGSATLYSCDTMSNKSDYPAYFGSWRGLYEWRCKIVNVVLCLLSLS